MSTLTAGQLAFLALSNEYCQALENASQTSRTEFIESMLRLLPRIYIAASDLPMPAILDPEAYVPDSLEEDYYDAVRRSVEGILGEDDTYLEVFVEDMKYSDTPIGASISEGLADIFQVLFNITEACRQAMPEVIAIFLQGAKEDFISYWSQSLCNVLRAINSIRPTL